MERDVFKLAWHSHLNLRVILPPLCRCFISGGTDSRCGQSCLCSQLDRHATNQRKEACDAGSTATSLELPKAFPTRDTRLRLTALVLQTLLWMDLTPNPDAKTCALWFMGLRVCLNIPLSVKSVLLNCRKLTIYPWNCPCNCLHRDRGQVYPPAIMIIQKHALKYTRTSKRTGKHLGEKKSI